MTPIGRLITENCGICIHKDANQSEYPCNDCYSLDLSKTKQYFSSRDDQPGPFINAPVDNVDLLTMQNEQLQMEVALLTDAHRRLRRDFEKLTQELRQVLARERARKEQEEYRYKYMEHESHHRLLREKHRRYLERAMKHQKLVKDMTWEKL